MPTQPCLMCGCMVMLFSSNVGGNRCGLVLPSGRSTSRHVGSGVSHPDRCATHAFALQVLRVLGQDESRLSPAEPPAALQASLPSPAARASTSGHSPAHSQHGSAPVQGQTVEADQIAGMLDAHMAVEQINTPQAR